MTSPLAQRKPLPKVKAHRWSPTPRLSFQPLAHPANPSRPSRPAVLAAVVYTKETITASNNTNQLYAGGWGTPHSGDKGEASGPAPCSSGNPHPGPSGFRVLKTVQGNLRQTNILVCLQAALQNISNITINNTTIKQHQGHPLACHKLRSLHTC